MQPAPTLALGHHVGVDADQRVVDEDRAVDLPDIDRADVVRGDDRDRQLELERDAEILGEVVERADRQNPHGHAGAGEHARDAADRTVAAADDQAVDLPGQRRIARLQGPVAQLVPRGEGELGRHLVRREGDGQALPQPIDAEASDGPATAVDQDPQAEAGRGCCGRTLSSCRLAPGNGRAVVVARLIGGHAAPAHGRVAGVPGREAAR